jgi:hypothetical protein
VIGDFLKYDVYMRMNTNERIIKIASNNTIGEADADAIISDGELIYCRGVASILKPHA